MSKCQIMSECDFTIISIPREYSTKLSNLYCNKFILNTLWFLFPLRFFRLSGKFRLIMAKKVKSACEIVLNYASVDNNYFFEIFI